MTTVTIVPETSVAVNPLLDSVVIPAAAALMIVVGMVLLVACANLASFLLAQARDRRKEVAIRLAVGAKRSVLVRQFLIESLCLASVAGVAGTPVSLTSTPFVRPPKIATPAGVVLPASGWMRVYPTSGSVPAPSVKTDTPPRSVSV